MFRKARYLAGVAAVAAGALGLTGTAAVTSATQASAATPSCGTFCLNIFSREFGTYHHPAFVGDVFRQGLRTGQPIILFKASNADPAEDFTLSFQGLVSDFFAAGMVSPQVMLHYGCTPGLVFSNGQGGTITCFPGSQDEPAFEIEYAPYGVDSGLCMGTPAARLPAVGSAKVSLQPCGVDSRTVWIWDTYDQPAPWVNGFTYPAINGSDTNFSHPSVLSYPSNGFPTDLPRPQLQVTNLTGFSNGFGPIVGQVPDWQLWGGVFGVLH
jgi:hypothetical protein